MSNMESSRFFELKRSFNTAPNGIREHIIDYNHIIEEKTRDFVGRQFVFDAISEFTTSNPRGYFIISCDPGIGKTSIAAQLVKIYGLVHHFNIGASGIDTPEHFLSNICSQLIAAFKLPYNHLPPEATHGAEFLYQILSEISLTLIPNDKAIIVVDALDEVSSFSIPPKANVLYLPTTLPKNIYVVATMRRSPVKLFIECETITLNIENESPYNVQDVREYLLKIANKPFFQEIMEQSEIDQDDLVNILINNSEGSFLYLHYIISDILERGTLNTNSIPQGLHSYYEDYWRRIQGQDTQAWLEYKLPIIATLAVIKEAIPIDLISNFSGVENKPLIREALRQWAPFLHEEIIQKGAISQKRYRLYHPSFQDFIASKEKATSERVDLRGAHKKIADALWKELFGND